MMVWTNFRTLFFSALTGMILVTGASPASAQMPVDGASDRRAGGYVYFKAFGKPKLPMEDLTDVAKVRGDSADYFESELATCETGKPGCSADTVYELADRFCQALEFEEAVTWRTSLDGDKLTLHWAVCGLKE